MGSGKIFAESLIEQSAEPPMKLSKNQRAATFIGWLPCEGLDHPNYRYPYIDHRYDEAAKLWRCRYCDRDGRTDIRDIHGLCPDMKRPENYMQALENVATKKLGPALVYDERCGQWHCDLAFVPGGRAYEHYADDAGQAVVAALAALYDSTKLYFNVVDNSEDGHKTLSYQDCVREFGHQFVHKVIQAKGKTIIFEERMESHMINEIKVSLLWTK